MPPTFLNHKVAGIPCLVGVTQYVSVSPWRGSPESCPSSADYYGYTECEYLLYDRKGYRAKWLGKKLTPLEKDRIEALIHEHYNTPEEP